MPQSFQFPDAQSLFWLPYTLGPRSARVAPIARLAKGVSIEVASSNVGTVLQQIRKTDPRVPGRTSTLTASRFEVQTIQEHLVAPVRPRASGGAGPTSLDTWTRCGVHPART